MNTILTQVGECSDMISTVGGNVDIGTGRVSTVSGMLVTVPSSISTAKGMSLQPEQLIQAAIKKYTDTTTTPFVSGEPTPYVSGEPMP